MRITPSHNKNSQIEKLIVFEKFSIHLLATNKDIKQLITTVGMDIRNISFAFRFIILVLYIISVLVLRHLHKYRNLKLQLFRLTLIHSQLHSKVDFDGLCLFYDE